MAFVKTDGKQLGNLGRQRVWTEERSRYGNL